MNMTEFSKFKDIQAVMDKAVKSLPGIELQYSACLHEEKIPESLLVDTKDYLANLRSSLDYLWHKIPDIAGDHFPVANSEADFLAKTKNVDITHVASLKKYQDYSPNGWLRCFNMFRNKNAHVTLIPQKRKETKEFTVKSHAGSATFRNCQFNSAAGSVAFGDILLTVDVQSQFPVDTPGLDIKRIIWVDFVFDGSSISPDFPAGISALPFLKESLTRVQAIVSELEEKL